MSRPTIKDVADRAGVARSTVSRVLNNAPGASPAVRARVHRVMAELDYVPDQTARALASGRQRAIDVVAYTGGQVGGWLGSHPYYSRVLAGIVPALAGTDVQIRVHAIAAPEDADAIAAHATVGAVLTDVPAAIARRLRERCRRVVSLGATSASVATIDADNTGGAYAAVQHLHRLGRTRIAAIHGPGTSADARDRRAGYRAAMRDLGLPVFEDGGAFRREDGWAAADRLLRQYPRIDGLFVACDLMAAGAVQAVTAGGRGVPGDVSVIGFDDSVAAVCTNPPLTTMRFPVEEMAAAAARLLLAGDVPAGHRRRFPVGLVTRASTAQRGQPGDGEQ
ncbi:LacI family DNA-binding transcriptional regulator [Dactylosporangium sp. NPDC051541]|uniref:LacI family DNA-binding transcriptional regulator n=1 Tax=Dactylosporangium sp. NPDC051541 TaxID=3363977 RepID=UPI0037999DAB